MVDIKDLLEPLDRLRVELQLDRTLADLFAFVDKQVGLDKVVERLREASQAATAVAGAGEGADT